MLSIKIFDDTLTPWNLLCLNRFIKYFYKHHVPKGKNLTIYWRPDTSSDRGGECESTSKWAIVRVNSDKADFNSCLVVLAHEFIHAMQAFEGRFGLDEGGENYFFESKLYPLDYEYMEQPWEIEAYARQLPFAQEICRKMFEAA